MCHFVPVVPLGVLVIGTLYPLVSKGFTYVPVIPVHFQFPVYLGSVPRDLCSFMYWFSYILSFNKNNKNNRNKAQ